MNMAGMGWTLRRLAGMQPAEILHRLGEQDRRWRDRRRHRHPAHEKGPAPALQNTNGTLIGLPLDEDAFRRLAPACLSQWQDEATRVRLGAWHFLGRDWPVVPLDRLWHLDPATGAAWDARRFCFDIPYRHRADRGDIKYVWEVNRLQMLPVVAALWRAEGHARDRRFCLNALDSWITHNPPYRGVNWCSGIEVALRAVSLLATVALLGADTLDAGLRDRLTAALAAHFHWLLRYPSRYSSANNHRIAELAGLYILARQLPSLDPDGAAATGYLQELGHEVTRQIHPDGVGAEQSPSYTAFSLEWICLAQSVARTARESLSDAALKHMGNTASHLRAIMDETGAVPRIGDDDEGRVILSGAAAEPDYVAQILASLCATLGSSQHAPPRLGAHLRQLWLGEPAPKSAPPPATAPAPPPARNRSAPAPVVRHFDAGGYTSLRHSGAGRESLLVMDHGPLGYLSIAAHGHADALAVWWHLGGQPVLVDAGTYLYHSGGAMRDRFRGTALHNTLCLDGMDQSRIAGPFNWSRKARARRLNAQELPATVLARHDGYLRSHGVVHQRSAQMDRTGGFILRDRLAGRLRRPQAQATLNFLLHPEIAHHVTPEGISLFGPEGPLALVRMTGANGTPLRPDVVECPYSPSFGRLGRTHAIRISLPAAQVSGQGIETRFDPL